MNSRIQIYSAAGEILPESPWVFPGLKLYGIAISSATRDLESNTAMVYITGNSMSDPTGTTGQLMLVPASMDPTNPAALGSGAILTSWSIPSMLHNVTSTETPVNQLLLSTLSTIPAQPAQAFQQSTARPLMAQNQSPSPPVWPTKFTANLLLHPFNWGDLPQVAQVTYSAGAFIQFDVFTLAGMQSSFLFTQMPSSVQMWYRVSNNLPWQGPFATSMTIPPCDWLVSKTTYQGDAPILQINNSWWCEQLQDTNTTTNWVGEISLNISWTD